jgi:hypothetical protein
MTFAYHATCYFFHSKFARSPYLDLMIFPNSDCCRQVTLVEVVPGTDVTIIVQAQSSAWRWNIGITQVSNVKCIRLFTLSVIVWQRWAPKLFFCPLITNPQIHIFILLSQIRKFLRCASPQTCFTFIFNSFCGAKKQI